MKSLKIQAKSSAPKTSLHFKVSVLDLVQQVRQRLTPGLAQLGRISFNCKILPNLIEVEDGVLRTCWHRERVYLSHVRLCEVVGSLEHRDVLEFASGKCPPLTTEMIKQKKGVVKGYSNTFLALNHGASWIFREIMAKSSQTFLNISKQCIVHVLFC